MIPSVASMIGANARPVEAGGPPAGGHRYWGYRIVAADNPDAWYAPTLREAKMYAAIGGANLLTNSAKAFATSSSGGNAPSNLIDGNYATWWQTYGAPATAVWWYDFDAPIEIISAMLRPHSDNGVRVTQAEIVYSDDATTWTTAWVLNPRSNTNSAKFKYDPSLDFDAVTMPVGFKEFAIQMEYQTSNAFSMAEVKMKVASGGSDVIPLVAVTATADEEYSAATAASKAIDGDSATNWASHDFTPAVGQKWMIAFDCVDPIGVVEIQIQANNDPSYHDQTPRDFIVMGKRSGGEWSPLWMVETGDWTVSETRTFTCPFNYGDGNPPVSP